MAQASETVSSWPGLLAQVNNAFNLLRDIFGYALPGGVFLAVGLLSENFTLSGVANLLSPYHPPTWAFIVLVLAACYIVGEILAATAYMPISLVKWLVWMAERREWWTVSKVTLAWLHDNPTEVSPELLEARSRHGNLFLSLDRRETLTILAGSTGVALFGGWLVFFEWDWQVQTMVWVAGVIVLIQFATGMSHLRRVAGAIRKADKNLSRVPVPDSSPDKLPNQMIALVVKPDDTGE